MISCRKRNQRHLLVNYYSRSRHSWSCCSVCQWRLSGVKCICQSRSWRFWPSRSDSALLSRSSQTRSICLQSKGFVALSLHAFLTILKALRNHSINCEHGWKLRWICLSANWNFAPQRQHVKYGELGTSILHCICYSILWRFKWIKCWTLISTMFWSGITQCFRVNFLTLWKWRRTELGEGGKKRVQKRFHTS